SCMRGELRSGERADQGNDGEDCREDDLTERRRAGVSDVVAFLSVLAENVMRLRHERGLDAVEEEKRCVGENKRTEFRRTERSRKDDDRSEICDRDERLIGESPEAHP